MWSTTLLTPFVSRYAPDISVTKYLSNTLFLSIFTLIKSVDGFGDMVTPALSFSTLKGTDPGSPTIRVNV